MIAPQTDVYLLNTVLENDGVNTLTWSSETRQRNYFLSCRVFTLSDFLYLRQDSAIKVEIPVDNLYGSVNYVMYRNTGYTNKWFYAFIDRLEYVNDNTTLIYIRTDEFQTWQFDLVYRTSYVIREHTNDDTIGANRLDEGLGLGDYICEKKDAMWDTTLQPRIAILEGVNSQTSTDVQASVNYVDIPEESRADKYFLINPRMLYNATGWSSGSVDVVLAIGKDTVDLVWLPSGGGNFVTLTNRYIDNYGLTMRPGYELGTIDDVVSFHLVINVEQGTITTQSSVSYLDNNVFGYNFRVGTLHTNTVNEWLQNLMDFSLADDIGALYLVPPVTVPATSNGSLANKATKTFTLTRTLDGYTPKNKKLLCFPYTTVKVHNASDSNRVLRPELFYTYGNCSFEYWSDFAPSCTVTAVPLNYAGVRESLEYSINSRKYPLSSGGYDAYQNYLGIHSAERNIRIAGGIASTAMSLLPFVAGGVGIGSEIGGLFYNQYKNKGTNTSINSGTYRRGNNAYSTRSRTESGTTSLGTHGATLSGYQRLSNVSGSALSVAGLLAEENAKRNEAYGTVGTISNNNLNAINRLNIYIEQQTITYDYAKRIDDYFSMYGYKTNMLKVPNITGRRNWNFVQLRNANVTGAIPNDSLDTIRAMLINGVTFWHNPSTYLDYTQNNDII